MAEKIEYRKGQRVLVDGRVDSAAGPEPKKGTVVYFNDWTDPGFPKYRRSNPTVWVFLDGWPANTGTARLDMKDVLSVLPDEEQDVIYAKHGRKTKKFAFVEWEEMLSSLPSIF